MAARALVAAARSARPPAASLSNGGRPPAPRSHVTVHHGVNVTAPAPALSAGPRIEGRLAGAPSTTTTTTTTSTVTARNAGPARPAPTLCSITGLHDPTSDGRCRDCGDLTTDPRLDPPDGGLPSYIRSQERTS